MRAGRRGDDQRVNFRVGQHRLNLRQRLGARKIGFDERAAFRAGVHDDISPRTFSGAEKFRSRFGPQ